MPADLKTRIFIPALQAVVAIFGTIWVLERGFALAGIGEQEFLELNKELGFAPMPNKKVTWRKEGFGIHIYNQAGIPDTQATADKPANTLRIAVLGDSMVQGLEVKPEENFQQLTESALNTKSAKTGNSLRYQFINFGVSNYTLGQSYVQLKEKVLAYHPDLVIVCSRPDSFARLKPHEITGLSTATMFFTLADAAQSVRAGNLLESREAMDKWLTSREAKRVRWAQQLRRHSRIWGAISQALETSRVDDARHWDAQYLLDTPKPLSSRQMLKNWRDRGAIKDKPTEAIAPLAGTILLTMEKLCQDNNMRFAIRRLPAEEGYTNPDENNYLAKLSKENNLTYIDCTDVFRDHLKTNPENPLFYFVHMNKNGHRLVAEQLISRLSDRPDKGITPP